MARESFVASSTSLSAREERSWAEAGHDRESDQECSRRVCDDAASQGDGRNVKTGTSLFIVESCVKAPLSV